jgi:hypothetical protein
MALFDDLKKKALGVYHQVTPFDHNQTYSTTVNNIRPGAPAAPRMNLSQPQLRVSQPIQTPKISIAQPSLPKIATPQIQTPKIATVKVAPQQNLKVGNINVAPNPNTRTGIAAPQPKASFKEKAGALGTGILSGAEHAAANTVKAATDVRFLTPNFVPGVSRYVDPTIHKIADASSRPFENASKGFANVGVQRGYNMNQTTNSAMKFGNIVGQGTVYVPQAVNAARDIAIAAPKAVSAVKTLPKTVEGGINVINKGAKTLDQAAFTTPATRQSKNELRTLSDYADYKMGRYKPDIPTVNKLVSDAYKIGDKHGIDVKRGSAQEIQDRITNHLENMASVNRGIERGGAKAKDIFPDRLFKDSNPDSSHPETPADMQQALARLKESTTKHSGSDATKASVSDNASSPGQTNLLQKPNKELRQQSAIQVRRASSSDNGLSQMQEPKATPTLQPSNPEPVPSPLPPINNDSILQSMDKKSKGFILKEGPVRNGRQEVIRVKLNKEQGKLEPSLETIDAPLKALDQPNITNKLEDFGPSLDGSVTQTPPTLPQVSKAFKDSKPDFIESTNKFLGSKQSAQTTNTLTARQLPKLDNNQSLGLIDALENGIGTGDFGSIKGQVRQLLDAKHQQLSEAGVDIGYLQDYFPHKWQNEDKVKQAYQTLKLRDGIQNERTLPTVREGMALGFKPVTSDYRIAVKNYLDAADRLLANRSYFKELKDKNLIVESPDRPMGLQVVDAPGMPQPMPFKNPETGEVIQGNYYADPTVAKEINKLFGPDIRGTGGNILKGAANVSKGIQTIFLSGGVPHSAVNAFGLAQWTKQVLSGRPISATMNLARSFSESKAMNYEAKNIDFIKKMESGPGAVPYRGTLDAKSLTSFGDKIAEASGAGKAKALITESWSKVMEDGTFRRYLPALQLDTFKGVYLKQIKNGADEATAIRTAQDATRRAFGINSMAKDALKSKVGNDALSAAFFAPKYRESMINFWKDNAKALGHPGSPAYRENLKFMAGATLLFGAMQAANEAVNGVPTWQNENPNDRFNLSIPIKDGHSIAIPFLSSIATVPRTAINAGVDLATGNPKEAGMEAKKFASQLIRPPIDLLTNQKYNGRQVYSPTDPAAKRIADQAGYFIGQYNHPWVQAAINSATGKSSGAFETAATATEAPIRFRNYDYQPKTDAENPTADERIKQAFTTPEAKKFLALSPADQKALASTDPDVAQLYKDIQTAKKIYSSPPVRPVGLNADYAKQTLGVDIDPTQVLNHYATMTDQAKEREFNKKNDAEFNYKISQYLQDKLNGNISEIDDIKKQNELAKLYVGKDFDKTARDLYGLNKTELYSYLTTNNNGKALADKILAYDDALTATGVQKKNKFRDKYGNPDFDPASSGSGGGKGGGGTKNAVGIAKALYTKPETVKLATYKFGHKKVGSHKVRVKKGKKVSVKVKV